MDPYHLISGGTLILAGVFIAWMAYAARNGSLQPNSWIGIRTPELMASEEKWRAGHKAASATLFVSAAGTIVTGVISLFVSFDAVAIVAMVGIAWLLVFLFRGASQASKAAKAV